MRVVQLENYSALKMVKKWASLTPMLATRLEIMKEYSRAWLWDGM